ncbi:MAG: hypothetical protein LBN32_01160 [Helicobacteraceae bacterium]|nr:hypothetical protein [Helicobacteraceae bacterium]
MKKTNWKLKLFIGGIVVSSALAALAIYSFTSAEFSWALCAALIGVCALPAAIASAPYFNANFHVSYSRQRGLEIKEETKSKSVKSADCACDKEAK